MTDGDKAQPVTRHDFWRACYATLLSELPLERVAEFFRERPFTLDGRAYSGAGLLGHLWKEKASIPMDWNYAGVDALEPFLLGNGVDPGDFMRKLLSRNNRATWMPGKVVLSWFYPIVDKVFRNNDPREMVFRLISVFTESYLPGHLHRCVAKRDLGDRLESYLVYATHRNFDGKIKFNFDLIAGSQILAAPNAINLPAFESIGFLADQRDPGDILPGGHPGADPGREGFRDGLPGFARKGFHAFLADAGLDLSGLKVPDCEVLVAGADVRCPFRRRVVIHAGCAYGAPVYVSRLSYKPLRRTGKGYLKHLIDDTVAEEDLFGHRILERHTELMRMLEERLEFRYFAQDDSMTVNGEHLVRGIGARILRNLLAEHLATGRCEFEYRDFKRDVEISLGQKNANFEVRFYRLVERLQAKCPQIEIRRLDRGKFRFQCGCRLGFAEGEGSGGPGGASGAHQS